MPLDRLQPKVCEYLQVSESEFLAAYQAAQKEGNLVSYQKDAREFVYLPAYYEAEQYIADRISVLRDFSAPEEQEIYLNRAFNMQNYSEKQFYLHYLVVC